MVLVTAKLFGLGDTYNDGGICAGEQMYHPLVRERLSKMHQMQVRMFKKNKKTMNQIEIALETSGCHGA